MKVSELEGLQLDYFAAKANGDFVGSFAQEFGAAPRELPIELWEFEKIRGDKAHYSTNWTQGGPIIDRQKMQLAHHNGVWAAYTVDDSSLFASHGSTILIAAMRCFVASKFGDTVPE